MPMETKKRHVSAFDQNTQVFNSRPRRPVACTDNTRYTAAGTDLKGI